ncbi:integration host factor subunit alpha [uncultured Paraglaciecola sp.]|uniref:integration host factor subunit alpha n=1 Tax=uncultured Paraglaciecola sp. TaxID=1765024 RepID=UPI002615A8C7|nr:integration host factor subunit alpha [uncultured Paraglaciecola sp.]
MTLTKAKMAEHLHTELGLNKRESQELIEMFLAEMSRALEQGGCLKLSGFGNFNLRDKKQRPGRNPKTGEANPVSARRVVTFKAGKKLQNRIKYQQK